MKSYTILTEPLIELSRDNKKHLFTKLKNHSLRIFSYYFFKKYGGHNAVTRSLVAGLRNFGIATKLNPIIIYKKIEFCHVLADSEALLQAIELKKKGKIKFLIAGPNIVVMPSEKNRLITHPAIDLYLVPSEWVRDKYIKDQPSLKNCIRVWPSGIDISFWHVDKKKTTKKLTKILFYKKFNTKIQLFNKCTAFLKSINIDFIEITYGEYSIKEYKKILTDVDLMVVFGNTESQGLALLECWASNTPTLVLKKKFWFYDGQTFPASSAPYLTKSTGFFFENFSDFIFFISNWESLKNSFFPRIWVKNNLTDKKSVGLLLNIIYENLGRFHER